MDNISLVINKIYNNMIKIILSDIESDYHEVVCQKYMETLMNRYSDIDFDEGSIGEVYNFLYQMEYNEWNSMPAAVKKHSFMKDDVLNKIIDLASIAFKYAKDKLDNNVVISKQLANEYILNLNSLYNDVEDFNKNLAMWYISEATVDLDYASNQTDSMSSRISRMKK